MISHALEAPTAIGTDTIESVTKTEELAANIYAVNITVKAPAMRPRIQNSVVQAKTKNGDLETVKEKGVAGGSYKTDIHPLFRDLAKNTTAIRHVQRRYSVHAPSMGKGVYLTPHDNIPRIWEELIDLRKERQALAVLLGEKNDEIHEGLIAQFPDHYDLFSHTVPGPEKWPELLSVVFNFQKLSSVDPQDWDLDEEAAAKLVEDHKVTVQGQFDMIIQCVMDDAAGSVIELCQQILGTHPSCKEGKSNLASGRKREGGMKEILDLLARLQDFHNFLTPEVLEKATQASKIVGQYTHQQVNKSKSVQGAIQAAMKPLHDELIRARQQAKAAQKPGSGRAGRDLTF